MDILENAKAYMDGATLDELAKLAGVSRGTITKRLREHVAIKKAGNSRPSTRPLPAEWVGIGLVPDSVIAERVGCTRQNVAKVRKARGIPSFRETTHKNARANNEH